jgi:LuxR family maltose regulon positive regulatory protein
VAKPADKAAVAVAGQSVRPPAATAAVSVDATAVAAAKPTRSATLVDAAALVNALAATSDPLVVVIDDVVVIDNPQIHTGVERLVELRPEHVLLVISTRVDPPFRLGRMRVRGPLTEIRVADLRFGHGEDWSAVHVAAGAARAVVERLLADL